jgi:hypothetical protein
MIRSVAVKMLHLDETVLASPPRVLLQHRDPDLPRQLARILPPHIAIDATTVLGQSLDLAEASRYELVIFEPHDLGDAAAAIASVLRAKLPAAGIFAIDAAGASEPWHPAGPLDGVLPRVLDPALGRGFLFANFLRPLVYFDGRTARVAGFQGPRCHHPAYLAMVERILRDRGSRLDPSLEIVIDLMDLDAEAPESAGVISRLHEHFHAEGGAPAFRARPDATRSLSDTRVLLVAT